MDLNESTIALCTSCGAAVVSRHDCLEQLRQNDESFDALGKIVFLTLRGELIARLHKARQ